ncbi:aldose epimerase [Escherichia coli]|nr:aldose epimerase [Escherichia coli]
MTIYTLSHGPLKLDVSDQGGVIEGFWRDTTPLLRLVKAVWQPIPLVFRWYHLQTG